MKTFFLQKKALLALVMMAIGAGNANAESGTLTTVTIGTGTVDLPIDYDHCQTNYSGKIKDGHFDSMKGSNYALYQIYNSAEEGAFNVDFKASTKQSSTITLTFQILDESNNVTSEVTSSAITGSSWDDFKDYTAIIGTIPTGESKLKIIFNSSDGGYTANVNKISLTPSNTVTYTISATVSPSDDAGTVSGTGNYAKGSDVVLTATPKWGYQFSKWIIGGTESTENPYPINNLSADTDVTATFVEGDSYFSQEVPGSLDITKTLCGGGNINASGYWENNKDGYNLTYLINVSEAGYYTFTAGIGTKNDDVTINATIKNASDKVVLDKTLDVTNNGSWSNFDTKYTWGCELPAGSYTLVFTTYRESSYTLNLQDVTVAKSDYVIYNIPADGIGTYCSNFKLDFSGTGATPYIITSAPSESSVTATPVEGVIPANTGIIVKGTGGEAISIPVSTSETTASVTGNKLMSVTEATTITYDSNNSYYVLSGGELHPVKESGTIAANRAYLFLEGVSSASRSLVLVFGDDETTGIDNLNRENANNNRYYDLQGRVVAQPTKGLYIVNSKKVIIK